MKELTGSYRDTLNKLFINIDDLEDREVTLTISRFIEEEVYDKKEGRFKKVPVAWFKELEERHAKDPNALNKRLVFNTQWNCKVMHKITGSTHWEDWKGCRIVLYKGNEGCRDKKQFGVRVKKAKDPT